MLDKFWVCSSHSKSLYQKPVNTLYLKPDFAVRTRPNPIKVSKGNPSPVFEKKQRVVQCACQKSVTTLENKSLDLAREESLTGVSKGL